MGRTPLFVNKQPGGMFSIEDMSRSTGNRFYVHSGTGTNAAGYGRSPDAPLASLAYFFLQDFPTANNGDIVYLMPGHAETVSAAAGIIADIAGVTIIGLGSGAAQPKITFDTIISADLDVDAASITFENIHFSANFADITAPLDINAADCTFRGCRFSETAVNMNAVIWILGATSTTSNRLKVIGCKCNDIDAANTHFVSLPGTSDGCEITDNLLLGDWGTAAIGAAGAVTAIVVARNYIYNAATDADSGINLAASSTGLVMHNSIGIALAGNATTGVTASTGVALVENYVVDIGDRQGVLDPIAT